MTGRAAKQAIQIDMPTNTLEHVLITTSTYTFLQADIEAFKVFVIDASVTNCTITIPATTLTGLQFINLIQESAGTITIIPAETVNQQQYVSTSTQNISLISRAANVWNLYRGDVTVSAFTIAVTGVEVLPVISTIDEGAATQLTVDFTPLNATIQTGTWSTNDALVATVSSEGLVTGVAAGSATITFTSTDGGFTDTSVVTVQAAQDMSSFGTIVSGYEAESIAGVEDDPISVWTDLYGVNNGTSSDQTLTTLKIVNSKKEVDFALAKFNLGAFTGMNFQPTVDSYSIVIQLGSRVTKLYDHFVFSKTGVSVSSGQCNMFLDDAGGGTFRPSMGGTIVTIGPEYNANDILIFTYDHTLGTEGQVKIYQNGSLFVTNDITGISSSNQSVDVVIGGRSSDLVRAYNGSIKGVWVYNGVLQQADITNIQSFLTA